MQFDAWSILIVIFAILLTGLYLFLLSQRTYRFARYFQLEGYNSKRYFLWLFRQQRELLYWLGNLVFVIVSILGWTTAYSNADEFGYSGLIIFPLALVANIVAAVLFLYFLPRDREIKQKFTPTQRASRLLITSLLIPLVISLVFIRYIIPSQIELIWTLILWGLLGGAVSLLLTPIAHPLANLINFPIEEGFRQYYLAKARGYLKRSGATVIAITGSYGKTTTKHYLNHILDGRFRVLMTPKSYNTLLGISRVINDVLAKDLSYDYFIAETDAYFVGENARICRLVKPTIGMIMTVGPMHLERLGSMENIEKAQYEVVEALPPDGAAFFNGDDPAVRKMADHNYPTTRQVVTQKGVSGAQVEAINVRMTTEGLDFDVRDNQTGETRSMHAPLYGEHNVTNILMAVAVAHYLGMSLTEIAMRVTTLQPAEHRLIRRIMPDGTIIIDDSYSANPVGTKTALDVLGLHKQSQRRVVISAGMFELGAVSDQENQKLGERMAQVATDAILIGAKQTEPVKAGLESAGFPHEKIHTVSTFNEAVDVYKGILRSGDALLMLTDLPDTYA